jgi:hypothetical protein
LLNGVVQGAAPWSTVGSVTITTGNANETVNIENTVAPATVTVNLGGGSDSISLSPTAHRLSNIESNLTLRGGPGFDILFVNDQANSSSTNWSLTRLLHILTQR